MNSQKDTFLSRAEKYQGILSKLRREEPDSDWCIIVASYIVMNLVMHKLSIVGVTVPAGFSATTLKTYKDTYGLSKLNNHEIRKHLLQYQAAYNAISKDYRDLWVECNAVRYDLVIHNETEIHRILTTYYNPIIQFMNRQLNLNLSTI